MYHWLEEYYALDDAEEERKKKEEERERKRKAQEKPAAKIVTTSVKESKTKKDSQISLLICWKMEKKWRKKMIAYKAFQKNLSCLGFQYKEAEWNYTEKAACRKTGFHCAENPLDCLIYYSDPD